MIAGNFYLVARTKGTYCRVLAARLTSYAPALKPGEVCILLEMKLPAALFKKPTFRASVEIPSDRVTPEKIDAVVLDNVRDVLEQQTGFRVEVALVEPTK